MLHAEGNICKNSRHKEMTFLSLTQEKQYDPLLLCSCCAKVFCAHSEWKVDPECGQVIKQDLCEFWRVPLSLQLLVILRGRPALCLCWACCCHCIGECINTHSLLHNSLEILSFKLRLTSEGFPTCFHSGMHIWANTQGVHDRMMRRALWSFGLKC